MQYVIRSNNKKWINGEEIWGMGTGFCIAPAFYYSSELFSLPGIDFKFSE